MKIVNQPYPLIKHMLRGLVLFSIVLAPAVSLYAAEKPRIAIVISASIKPYKEALTGFDNELKSLGIYPETREFFLGNGNGEDFVLREISNFRPDMIHSIGSKATKLVKKNFYKSPIIFSMVLNPEASGLVDTMAVPGHNVTGASMDIPFSQQFKTIKRILPAVKTIGIIYSKEETGTVVAHAERIASRMGIKLLKAEISSPADIISALNKLAGNVDFLWSVADGNVFTRETTREILITTLREGIPFMGLSPAFVRAGALAALESSPDDTGREAARLLKRVLDGESPAGISVTPANKVTLYLNRNTIDLIGIEVPDDVYRSAVIIKP